MRTKLLVGATAAAVMALAAGTAAARNYSLNHGRSWNIIWHPVRVLTIEGTTLAECDLTLEGSFHNTTMAKVRGTLMGQVVRASVSGCRIGGATVLGEAFPWHIQYRSFEGTLPSITGISFNIVGLRMRIREATFGFECLMLSSETSLILKARLSLGAETRTFTGIVPDAATSMPCGELYNVKFGRNALITELPEGFANLEVKLI
jgi:hypothetical protein